jgi:hypothetical protein
MTKEKAWEKFKTWSNGEEPTNWETFLFTWDACLNRTCTCPNRVMVGEKYCSECGGKIEDMEGEP